MRHYINSWSLTIIIIITYITPKRKPCQSMHVHIGNSEDYILNSNNYLAEGKFLVTPYLFVLNVGTDLYFYSFLFLLSSHLLPQLIEPYHPLVAKELLLKNPFARLSTTILWLCKNRIIFGLYSLPSCIPDDYMIAASHDATW